MPSYFLRPEKDDFLSSLHGDPLLAEVSIKEIGIDPERHKWVFFLRGAQKGSAELWAEVADAVKAAVPEVAEVSFVWEEKESDDYYLRKAIEQVNSIQVAAAAEAKNGNGNNGSNNNRGRNRGRRRNLLVDSIRGEAVPIADLQEEAPGVVILGEVIDFSSRTTRSDSILVMFDVYDGTDTLSCKVFVNDAADLTLKTGDWVKVRGNLQFQPFDNQLALMVQSVCMVESPPGLSDDAMEKRVELHLHTKMSGLDGVIDVDQAVELAASLGHDAIAITDHGVVQAFPDAYRAGKKHGVKIIYGVEGYLIDDPDSRERGYHIVILAKNQTGLKNLYRLVSESHLNYFYHRPRIPRDLLKQYREGLILGSACEAGEVYRAILQQSPQVMEIASFYDYLEIMPLENNEFLLSMPSEGINVRTKEDLIRINQQIVMLGERLGIPVVATGDAHFLRPEDSLVRSILLAGHGFADAERQAPLFYRTTQEMLAEFAYLGPEKAQEVVVTNSRLIAAQVENLSPVPQGLHPPKIENADVMLHELTYAGAHTVYGPDLPEIVQARLDRELKAITGNGYASLYVIAHKLVKKSMDEGYLVGSRGSVGSSLVATMCGITEVNPLPPHYICGSCHWTEFFVKGEVGCGVDLPQKDCPECGELLQRHGFEIPFEVFMGFHGDKVPDIDLNFSGDYQAEIHKYTEELLGQENVYRAGTIGTLAERTAYGFIMNFLEQTQMTKRPAEVNRLVKKLTGVRRTTGQHPGGMVVVPPEMDILDFTPIQYPANDSASGTITTHFEYHALDDSLVKLDILGHDDPTMLRFLQDLTGVPVLEIDLDDPETMCLFSSLDTLGVTEEEIGTPVGTLGIPEFGTRFVRQMLTETKPKTFSDLIRISGLSHGTNVWTNNAQDLVKAGTLSLSEVIATRDDIMTYLMLMGLEAGDAFRIMEQVRRGRGLTEEDEKLMRSFNVPEWYLDSCKKISYMFPKAHAVAYVMMAFRIAYFKVHYPLAFYAALFSLRSGEFDAHLVCAGEGRIRAEIETINAKGFDATARERSMVTQLEIVLEAMVRGIRFLPVDLYKSDQQRFLIEDDALRPPLASLQGLGVNAAARIAQAREEGEFISIEDLRQRSGITKAVVETLRAHGCLQGLPETNQLTLF